MFGKFDQDVFDASVVTVNARIEARGFKNKDRQRADKALSGAIEAEAVLAARRLSDQVWPDGAFVAKVTRFFYWENKKAKPHKLLHIFGDDWDGDIDAPVTIGQSPLWLADHGKVCARTHYGGVAVPLDAVAPFWQYGESRDSGIVRNRDGVAILTTLRALGTT